MYNKNINISAQTFPNTSQEKWALKLHFSIPKMGYNLKVLKNSNKINT